MRCTWVGNATRRSGQCHLQACPASSKDTERYPDRTAEWYSLLFNTYQRQRASRATGEAKVSLWMLSKVKVPLSMLTIIPTWIQSASSCLALAMGSRWPRPLLSKWPPIWGRLSWALLRRLSDSKYFGREYSALFIFTYNSITFTLMDIWSQSGGYHIWSQLFTLLTTMRNGRRWCLWITGARTEKEVRSNELEFYSHRWIAFSFFHSSS